MKSMRKILSAILTVALLASFFVMPVHAISDDAQICATIDVLRGDSTAGVTATYLAKNTNRSQGAKIYLRLIGLEVEADTYTGSATFPDASEATDYWQPMLAYLKANPTIGFSGYPDGTFAPNKIMTAQEIYKVLLVSLGYVENVDFTWGEVFTFAASVGLTQLNGTAEITNDDLATALVEALNANKKDGTKLIDFLIEEGVVDLVDAQNAGLVAKTLAIVDAFASGSKEITANLNMSAPAGTSVKLMRGSVTWPADVTWESNNKVVKFSRSYNFTPGDYTVVVGDNTFPLTVEEEHLIGISIGADYVYPRAGQDLDVGFYNQYGEEMHIPGSAYVIVLFPRLGMTLPTTNTGSSITVDASAIGAVESDDTVMITIYEDTFSQTKTIPVYQDPVIKSLYISGLEITNDAPKINENTSAHRLVIEAADQYGNPYKLSASDLAAFGGTVQITSSNESVVPSTSFTIDSDGKLVFNAVDAGQARITIIIPLSAIIKYYDITVSEPATVDTLVINTGSGMITSGTRYDLTTFAYDQLGTSIPLLGNFDSSKFSFSSTDLTVVPIGSIQYDATKGVLYLIPAAPGTATVTYSYGGEYQGYVSITVYEAPKPQYIHSISFPDYFEVEATKALTLDNFVVRDQYGQVFDMDRPDYSIEIQTTSGTTLTVGNAVSGSVEPVMTAGTTEGSTTFSFAVKHNSTVVNGSQISKTITVKETEDITSYKFESVGKMYGDPSVAGMPQYHKTLKINGLIGSSEVVLAGGPVPSAISPITNSNGDFVLNAGTLEIYATDKGTTTVNAYVNGSVVASVSITADDEAPRVTSIVFDPTTKTVPAGGTFDVKSILTIKDQYGVNMTSTANVYYSSSNTTVATINSSSGVVSPLATGTTNISVVELSGAGSAVLTLNVQ